MLSRSTWLLARHAAALRCGGRPSLAAVRLRCLCTPPQKPPADAEGTAKPPPEGETAAEASSAPPPTTSVEAADGYQSGGLLLQEHEGENLPPLEFEPGVAGAAQKGVSAIVIAFGAVAFAGIAWGASVALFPGATSTQAIYSEAFEKVQADPTISYALGSPLKAYGVDHGGGRGRRNEFQRWETTDEAGDEVSIVRFTVSGPQGGGYCTVSVPKARRRGDFKYIMFQSGRAVVPVLDNRLAEAEEAAPKPAGAAQVAAGAPAATADDSAVPPPPPPIAPAAAGA